MLKIKETLLLTSLGLVLGACGGSDPADNAPAANKPPVVTVDNEQQIDEQTKVTLTGVANDDGTVVSSLWHQTSGPTVELKDSNSLTASFNAPELLMSDGPQTLSFSLAVTDNDGAVTAQSINIIINPVKEFPVARAGSRQTYLNNETIQLDCNGSYDPDGNVLNYL